MKNYLTIILFLIISLFTLNINAVEIELPTKENFHLFLLIGQSNMAGRDAIEPIDTVSLENVLLLNDSAQWENAKNPLNVYSTIRKAISMQGVGLGYTFAKKLDSIVPNVKIGLVVNARGGSSITEWEKGDLYYNDAITRIKQAEEYGTIKGILWHQGEADAGFSSTYLIKLEQFIKDLRSDLGNDSLPFIAGQLGKWQKNYNALNDSLLKLPERVAFTDIVLSDSLTNFDIYHFDAASQRIFGKRYADKVYDLIYTNSASIIDQKDKNKNSPSFSVKVSPNPFVSKIHFDITNSSNAPISLNIYDIMGRRTLEVLNKQVNSNSLTIDWNTKQKTSNIYFAVFKLKNETITKKIIQLKR